MHLYDIHSTVLREDASGVSIHIELGDGSLAAVWISADELIRSAHVIDHGDRYS